jgi:flagellin-like hook-associated protein FlgL
MFPNISGTTQQYLADLARTETQLQQAQGQISSGYRLQQPSDDPKRPSPTTSRSRRT